MTHRMPALESQSGNQEEVKSEASKERDWAVQFGNRKRNAVLA